MIWTREWLVELGVSHPERLVELVLSLQAENGRWQTVAETLQQQLREKNQELSQQQEKLEQAQRAAFRQAAPFRLAQADRAQQPKKPGRKKGHPGSYRPRPQQIDQSIEVPLYGCPECGGTALQEVQLVEQFIEEIPLVRPVVTQLKTYTAFCSHCQKEVRSTHPLQMSVATGAAGTHLGANAVAILAELKSKGLSLRKVCAVVQALFALKITPGGLSHALRRVGKKCDPTYQGLKEEIRNAAVAHADETSWWLKNTQAWLWVFANKTTTLYVIDEGRGRDVVIEILGLEFAGVLVSDCLVIYEDINPLQQKCYSHHLKAIKEACAEHPQQATDYLANLKAMLQAAMALKKAQPEMAAEDFSLRRRGLDILAKALLVEPRSHPAEERVRNRLYKQIDHLFTFLDYAEVDATNNLAERQLRPAVISRKISCGNKTEAGAQTWQILSSLAATCAQRGKSFLQFVRTIMPWCQKPIVNLSG
jgi:transposase